MPCWNRKLETFHLHSIAIDSMYVNNIRKIPDNQTTDPLNSSISYEIVTTINEQCIVITAPDMYQSINMDTAPNLLTGWCSEIRYQFV